MGSPVRPEPAVPAGLSLSRILTPDEFHAAQVLPSATLAQPGIFPTLPKAPAESTRLPYLNQPDANPQAHTLPTFSNGQPGNVAEKLLGGALKYGVDPMLNNPLQTGVFLQSGALGSVAGMGMMAKDLAMYGIQKAREMQLSDADRAIAEGNPNRIKGEQAAWEAGMLALGPITHAIFSNVRPATIPMETDPARLASVGVYGNGFGGAAGQPAVPDNALTDLLAEAQKGPNPTSDAARASARPAPSDMEIPLGTDNGQARIIASARYSAGERTPEEQQLAQQAQADRQASRQAVIDDREANRAAVRADLQASRDAVKGHVASLVDAWRTAFQPSPEADLARGILRAQTGSMAAQYEQAAFKMDEFRRAVNTLSNDDRLHFIDAIETGNHESLDPVLQPLAATIRQTLDNTRDAIRNLGTGKLDNFIENYFPHIWDDPDRASDVFRSIGSKGPMEGPASFLKQRTIPTTKEGIAQGLNPITTNPIDLTLLKLREMQRYLMAHSAMNELAENNLTKFVRAGDLPPDGYKPIDDKIATVFGPRQGGVSLPEGAVKGVEIGPRGGMDTSGAEEMAPEDVQVFGKRIMGAYYAPEQVAGIVNNYLSPGLSTQLQRALPGPMGRAAAMTFDAYRGLGNTLNQAQLGLSAFHLGMTSLDANVSRNALAVEYLAQGDFKKAVGKALTAPVAAFPGIVSGLAHTFGFDDVNLGLGAKIRQAYLNPDAATPQMRDLAQAVREAGGRVRMDSYYATSAVQQMVDAWKEGDYGRSAFRAIGVPFELAAKPLMEHIVPLQKLQVFGEMAQKALADLPPDATLAERRSALQSAWDSTDNRMGQLVYDNLFWNKAIKDMAMASVRSVGWNLGTIRELGGGILDAITSGVKLFKGDEPPVADGYTRLYRGETASKPTGAGLPDWVKDNPEAQAALKATGRWFSGNRTAADYYAKTFGDDNARISYVDVPTADVEKYRVSNQPDVAKFSAAGRASEEFFIPPELAKQRTPITSAQLSHRTAYLLALPMTVGLYGAAYQLLRTGQGPSELKDYFYPKTGEVDANGNPERVQLPCYMKDLMAYAGSPFQTITHKVAPVPNALWEMLSNQDFYGDEIRNPTDPLVKQLGQEAEFIGKTAVPFGIRNMMESSQRGDQTETTKIGNFFGITPAPRSRVRGPGQNLMAEYADQNRTVGTSPEEVEARQQRSAILAGLRGNKGVDLDKAVNDAMESGNLTPAGIARLMKRAGMMPMQERFKALPLAQAMKVYQASDDREKAAFAELLAKKIERSTK